MEEKNLHSQLFTKHHFMKKANVLRAIKFNCHTSAVIILSNTLLVKTKTKQKKKQEEEEEKKKKP